MIRMLGLQACWSYDRMQGVGLAHVMEPLLATLLEKDPNRARAARGRAAEFFNGNPYLAGVAAGATARAETDGVAPEEVRRLRTALTGPLGALGDQLFWAGTVPALMGVTLVGVVLGTGAWMVAVAVALHNGFRVWVTRWGLQLGWTNGAGVGAAVAASWLPRAATRIGPAAALITGVAVPMTAAWLLGKELFGPEALGVVGGAVLLGIGLGPRLGARVSAVRLTLGAVVLVLLWHWGVP